MPLNSVLHERIANANGHPEWEGQIRDTFAERWIQRAKSGWGGWQSMSYRSRYFFIA